MINAGAIATHALAGDEGMSPSERTQRVVDGLSAFAGRRLEPDESVYTSELDNAHRNLAIGHMLRSHGVLERGAGIRRRRLLPSVRGARHRA